ncbi:MAG TPA: hypothetical protein VMW08_00475 [Acidimicrobiales bacterium]|nr:hypothetical protein [Acidimicrobiales bacterium]
MSATRYRATIEFTAGDEATYDQLIELLAQAEVQIAEPFIPGDDGNDTCEFDTTVIETTLTEV